MMNRCDEEAPSFVVRNLTIKDTPQLTEVHFQAFSKSVLTLMGKRATCSYYEWQFMSDRHKFFYPLGAFKENELVGFCLGGVFKGAMGDFLSKNKFLLLRALLLKPHLLFHEEFRKKIFFGISLLLQFKKKVSAQLVSEEVKVKKFGILSIAVNPAFQGCGIGNKLLAKSEKFAKENSFDSMSLTVDVKNYQAIRFYEKNGWERNLMNGQWLGGMSKRLK